MLSKIVSYALKIALVIAFIIAGANLINYAIEQELRIQNAQALEWLEDLPAEGGY